MNLPLPPAAPLFRAPVLERMAAEPYGAILLVHPLGQRWLTGMFALICIALIGFFCSFSFSRKVQVSGVLLPNAGLLAIASSQPGVILEQRVSEGQQVAAGDVLFVIQNDRETADRRSLTALLKTLFATRRQSLADDALQVQRQDLTRIAATQQQSAIRQQDLDRLLQQKLWQKQRVALTEQALERETALKAAHFISTAQLELKQAELLDQRQRLADIEGLLLAAQRDLDNLQASARDQRFQRERDRVASVRALASVDQEIAQADGQAQFLLTAPRAGVVTAIRAQAGQPVSSGQLLAQIVPADAHLQAELYAPSRAAGFMRLGMDVLLRYEAYPFQRFGAFHGHVIEISNTAMDPEALALADVALHGLAAREPVYRVRVALDEQQILLKEGARPLRSGMLLEASLVLEQRHLYEWVFEPFYTARGQW